MITAAILLHRNAHASKIDSSVLRPKSGVNPQNIPIATPPATACGASRICSNCSKRLLTNCIRFNEVFTYYTISRRAKTGSFTPTRINPKMTAAPNSLAITEKGSGAIAMPRIANIEMIITSATEDRTSHTVGRSPHTCRRPRMA